ncbi:MAG: hypothetical protein AAFP84_04725 [Actinomycetota bacterium]
MSTDPPSVIAHDRSLGDWIGELVHALDDDPLGGALRLRTVVGPRRARITVDDEVVDVAFVGGRLDVRPGSDGAAVDGSGATSTPVVIALLDGRLEVADAFHGGHITATGSRSSIGRIFHAIEILLDASARVPRLRDLAAEYRVAVGPHERSPRHTTNRRLEEDEHAVLVRLGIEGSGTSR